MNSTKYFISLVGPTAVGKTKTAIALAKTFKADIISTDSRQFFKELTIGTAKPSEDELQSANHHFINHLSISQNYNASDFEKDVLQFLASYFKKNKLIIGCGGSGMYVDAILKGFDHGLPSSDPKVRTKLIKLFDLKGIEALQEKLLELDPVFYREVDLNNNKRLLRAIEVCLISGQPYSSFRKGEKKEREFIPIKIGLQMDRKKLYERINRRVDKMIESGLIDEVKSLVDFQDKNALQTVGYQELFHYLNGECTLEFAIEKIKVNSRRYAKRQMTWFKKDSEIEWFESGENGEIIEYIRNRISIE